MSARSGQVVADILFAHLVLDILYDTIYIVIESIWLISLLAMSVGAVTSASGVDAVVESMVDGLGRGQASKLAAE